MQATMEIRDLESKGSSRKASSDSGTASPLDKLPFLPKTSASPSSLTAPSSKTASPSAPSSPAKAKTTKTAKKSKRAASLDKKDGKADASLPRPEADLKEDSKPDTDAPKSEPDIFRSNLPLKIADVTFETLYPKLPLLIASLWEQRSSWFSDSLQRPWFLLKKFSSAFTWDAELADLWNSRLLRLGFLDLYLAYFEDFYKNRYLSREYLLAPSVKTGVRPYPIRYMIWLTSAVWNATDCHTATCEAACEMGLPQRMLEALREEEALAPERVLPKDAKASAKTEWMFGVCGSSVSRSYVSVLNNCARRCVEGREGLRSAGAVETALAFRTADNDVTRAIATCLFAHTAGEAQIKGLKDTDEVVEFLLYIVTGCLDAELSTEGRFRGFSVEEVLDALGNLASGPEVQALLVRKDALATLATVLRSPKEPLELAQITRLFWSLSFDKRSAEAVRKGLPDLRKALTHHLKDLPKNMAHVRRAIAGCLWNYFGEVPGKDAEEKRRRELSAKPKKKSKGRGKAREAKDCDADIANIEEEVDDEDGDQDESQGGGGGGHVMMSYDWGKQASVLELNRGLRRAGLRTWVDVEEMSGSTLEAMARAVEGATVVVLCISERYKDSPNCRAEAEYAFRLHKPIVPVRMAEYRPDGWLGILLGTKLYLDCHRPDAAPGTAPKLAKEIHKAMGQTGSGGPAKALVEPSEPSTSVASASAAPSQKPKGCASWKGGKVRQWLGAAGLDHLRKAQHFGKDLTGADLSELKDVAASSPELFLAVLEKSGVQDGKDVLRLRRALRSLPDDD